MTTVTRKRFSQSIHILWMISKENLTSLYTIRHETSIIAYLCMAYNRHHKIHLIHYTWTKSTHLWFQFGKHLTTSRCPCVINSTTSCIAAHRLNTYSLGILKVGRIHCCLILLYYGIWPYYFIRKKRNIISGRIFQAPHYKINFALYNLYHWLHIILVAEGSKVQCHHQPKKFRCWLLWCFVTYIMVCNCSIGILPHVLYRDALYKEIVHRDTLSSGVSLRLFPRDASFWIRSLVVCNDLCDRCWYGIRLFWGKNSNGS